MTSWTTSSRGLYAINHDAGGVYDDTYDLKVDESTASAFAINSGRMAGETIVNGDLK